jgi:type VI protein secretion system component Hcp
MKQLKLVTMVLSVLVVPVAAFAQQGPPSRSNSPLVAPKSSITVAIPGLSCTTAAGASAFASESFSWGASNPVTIGGGGGGAGKVSISSLNLMKRFDACSPALFEAVAKGMAFKELTLTQRNSDGDPVATIVLRGVVLMESWQLSSSTGEAGPIESLSVAAQEFCVAESGGNRFCYDIVNAKVI